MFISSTYNDLKEIRSEVANFVVSYDYIPVIFEKDDVTFQLNSSIEESCYEEISECSLFILIIKEKFGAISKTHGKKVNSVTQTEYNVARSLGIPIFVFIYRSSLDEFRSWEKSGMDKQFKFYNLENIHLAYFIKEIFEDKTFRYIHDFISVDDIKLKLRKQWAGLFQKYLTAAQKFKIRENDSIYVNPFKLFYFRRHLGISQRILAEKSGLHERKIQKIEDAALKKRRLDLRDFEILSFAELTKIADILQCSIGNLKGGLPDDFLSQYLLYYFKNKGTTQKSKSIEKTISLFKTKIIVFDFDGTLTKQKDNLTTWEKLWLNLGYEVNDCAELHRKFSNSEISHKQWCDLTEKKFKNKKLSENHLSSIAEDFTLIEGASEVFEELFQNNIQLYICSGSIDYVIKKVLGKNIKFFQEIKSNKMIFDDKGMLKSIIGTKYDFEGKSDYISQIIRENQIQPFETLFVGNSLNDEWAHQSGAMTLCVNPSMTNPDHPFQWTYCIRDLRNFWDILKYIDYK